MVEFIKRLLGIKPPLDYAAIVAAGGIIIDVRSSMEYRSAHHPSVANVPLDAVQGYSTQIKDKNQVIVTCCASGVRSGYAKIILEKAGFTQVHNGGSWKSIKL
jgi:phage shock protein E